MSELNLDAESITRNKSYGAMQHLQHLLKIGWLPESPLVKRFILENQLSTKDINEALSKIKEDN
ncbi:MAG: hypothetical protein HYR97_05625 [Candidatus Melainabacteria bacterium]|nr:hypothetical protein [Candidatus Melainabacteria bacterium]MBI3308199.1 hypothetical protein [Candidatus Melainabacteria bacterium]